MWFGAGSARFDEHARPHRSRAARAVLGDDRVPAPRRVVDVEEPVRREPRVERDREQAPLSAGEHLRADVEERRRRLAGDADDPARLLDDVDRASLGARRRDVHRCVEAPTCASRRAFVAAGGRAGRQRGDEDDHGSPDRTQRSAGPEDVEHAARGVVVRVALGRGDPAVGDDRALPVHVADRQVGELRGPSPAGRRGCRPAPAT